MFFRALILTTVLAIGTIAYESSNSISVADYIAPASSMKSLTAKATDTPSFRVEDIVKTLLNRGEYGSSGAKQTATAIASASAAPPSSSSSSSAKANASKQPSSSAASTAAASKNLASASAASSAPTSSSNTSSNKNHGNSTSSNTNSSKNASPSSSLSLKSANVQTGSQSNGLNASDEPGQTASLTDAANFINFCSGQSLPLTNGLQLKGGSCNGIVMGQIPTVENMISTLITFPIPLQPLPASQTFNITLQVSNLQAGIFTNASSTYYAAPQQLSPSGKILGHAHVVIQSLGSSSQGVALTPPDARTFVFFKGINDAGDGKGGLSATVQGGLKAGDYRVCTMLSSGNHQPVLMPVAQRGAQDDCVRFTVSGTSGTGGGNKAVVTATNGTNTTNETSTTTSTVAGAAESSSGSNKEASAATGSNDSNDSNGKRSSELGSFTGGRRGRFVLRNFAE